MAAPAAATAPKKPALVLLELEYMDGGSSPWFNSKGRSFVASLTNGPVTADLFHALAEDGSMSTLASYIDSASPSVSNIGTICYALVGLILFLLFLLLPLALFGLRRFAATMGFLLWVIFELLLMIFAGLQLICLLVMLSTWYGMNKALVENIPMTYEWTFEVLQNYTILTVKMLQAAKGDKKELDNSLSMTTSGIKWLRGNISRWEDKFSAYAGLKSLLTGVVTMLHMGLLGFALVAVIASILLACGAWRRRTARLAKGRKSPVIVALAAIAATVLLCAHMVVALPMIARWLPICVLADTYLCAPYRDASYSILDNSVRMVWPLSSRPDPFCRLVPSTLFKKCMTKGKTPIKNLDACQTKKDKGKLMVLKPDDAVIEFQVPQPPQKPPAVNPATGSADKNVIGDCFYPFKIIHADMTSVCPLFTDDLLAHWMAMVLSVLTGFGTTISAAAVAVIFMAVSEPNKKSLRVPPPHRRVKRIRKRKHKRKKKKKPTPPSPVTPRSHTSVQTEGTPPGPTQLNIVLEEPFPVPIKRKRRSQPVMFIPAPPSPLPIPVPVPVSSSRYATFIAPHASRLTGRTTLGKRDGTSGYAG
ncbi:hypothetical protein MRX96_008025 [Rhipicephalus microplus]